MIIVCFTSATFQNVIKGGEGKTDRGREGGARGRTERTIYMWRMKKTFFGLGCADHSVQCLAIWLTCFPPLVYFVDMFTFLQYIGVTTRNPESDDAYFGWLYYTEGSPDYWLVSWEGNITHHGTEKVIYHLARFLSIAMSLTRKFVLHQCGSYTHLMNLLY